MRFVEMDTYFIRAALSSLVSVYSVCLAYTPNHGLNIAVPDTLFRSLHGFAVTSEVLIYKFVLDFAVSAERGVLNPFVAANYGVLDFLIGVDDCPGDFLVYIN